MISRTIKVGRKNIKAVSIKLGEKKLIVLVGKHGYVACGYLNLKAANKFKDAAVLITGVSSIDDALGSKVNSLTSQAKKLGIKRGQTIKEVLRIIA